MLKVDEDEADDEWKGEYNGVRWDILILSGPSHSSYFLRLVAS